MNCDYCNMLITGNQKRFKDKLFCNDHCRLEWGKQNADEVIDSDRKLNAFMEAVASSNIFNEQRMDVIGQNGNDGQHYEEATPDGSTAIYKESGKVKPSDVLRSGAQHMEDRAATYDKPEGERSMSATVQAFNAITGCDLTEEQGWLFMVQLKAVRSQQGDFKLDNYEDLCAYGALMAESAAEVRDV